MNLSGERKKNLWFVLIVTLITTLIIKSDPVFSGGDNRSEMILIPAGKFIMGSTPPEREYGYKLDKHLHNSSITRQNKLFEIEHRQEVTLATYWIDKYLVTNEDYQEFVNATGRPTPFVTQSTWSDYGVTQKYAATKRFLWREGRYPPGRSAHPVVLVSHADSSAYCSWRGRREGRKLSLPTEAEWEKASRGENGRFFPWGNEFDPDRLNSYDGGPFDSVPVGRYPSGATPYGGLDMAGMVNEWTTTRAEWDEKLYVVKGGSWLDLPGITRSAARRGHPAELKHILIGFRCTGPHSLN